MYRCRPGQVARSRSTTFPVASSSDPSDTVISMCSATDAVAWMTDPRARSKSAGRLRVGIVIDGTGEARRASSCPATGPNERHRPVDTSPLR